MLFSTSDLPVIGKIQSISWLVCSSSPCPVLEGMCDSDVEGSIPATIPVRDEDVSRPHHRARDQGPAFSGRCESSCSCSLVQGITQKVVPRDSLSPKATHQSMVAKDITGVVTGRARTSRVKDLQAHYS